MMCKGAHPICCRRMRCDQRGDTLIEVLAAMTILAIIIIPFSMLGVNVFQWLAADAHQGQAFTYARAGIQYVRQYELNAYSKNAASFPVPAPNQSLSPVSGIAYTESIVAGSPAWIPAKSSISSKLTLDSWTVTVSWVEPDTGVTHSVSLQTVVDPAISG